MAASCIACPLLFSGCSYHYYYPTNQHVNVLKQKGDLFASLAGGEEEVAYAAGYAITDHIGLIANFRNFNKMPEGKKYDTYYWEPEFVLIHDLTPLNESLTNWYASAHMAYGKGKVRRNQDFFLLDVGRFSVQPGIGFSNKYFDVAFSARFSRVDYDFQDAGTYNPSGMSLRDEYLLHDVGVKPFYFFEPALTLGGGYKFVKVKIQIVAAKQMGGGDIEFYDNVANLSASFYINALTTREK